MGFRRGRRGWDFWGFGSGWFGGRRGAQGANEGLVGKEKSQGCDGGSPLPSYQISIFPCMRIVERELQSRFVMMSSERQVHENF